LADIRIRFIGDASSLRSFYQNIGRETDRFVGKLNALNRIGFGQNLGIDNNLKGPGAVLGRITTTVDQYNGVLKSVAQSGLRFKDGTVLLTAETTKFHGSTEKLTEALANQAKIEQHANSVITRGQNVRRSLKRDIESYTTALTGANRTDLKSTQDIISTTRNRIQAISQELAARRAFERSLVKPLSGAAKEAFDTRTVSLQNERQQGYNLLARGQRTVNRLEQEYQHLITNDPSLGFLKRRYEQFNNFFKLRATNALSGRQAARDAVSTALVNPEVEVPKNIQTLMQQSPQLFRILSRAGLGSGASGGGLGQSLYQQQAQFSAPVRDLVRDVTRVSGSFLDNKNQLVQVTAEYDKSGKVITRFGGQLSGASQVLKQISRDFQKVIEWTVATTVVFTSLAYAASQLNTLKNIDASLARFAITAELSPTQARNSFDDLAKIAYQTATPLDQLINAADDIALATRKAGQSTEDWTKSILNLTQAVGIFTNLTGTDTVKATDLLTSTMKQLGVQSNDVITVLSKITAVAGGQSGAINEITQGLAVMAEAGKQAGLSIDQQIASVQVLSQVTSKSPAEVATAFKNLVGSLASPGSIKVLDKFNISLRDQQGNLRNILDVYKEISQKIREGIIPASDVQSVIRGISGGPRRAPDAAALLASIGQIDSAVKKSQSATNEAALANARVLDTTQAKITQLQVFLDTVTFKKFGGEFKEFIGGLSTFVLNVVQLLDKIPSGAVAAALQIGAFFLAIKVGSKALSFLISFIGETVSSLKLLGAQFVSTAGAARTFSTATTTGLVGPTGLPIASTAGAKSASLAALLKSNYKSIGIGAGVGAGLGALTGGGPQQIVGGGLQGLGLALLAIPEPTALTKIAGGISFVAGSLLSLAQSSKEIEEGDAEKATRFLDALTKFKDANRSVQDLTTVQKELSKTIDELNGKQHKTGEERAQLAEFQREYVTNVLDMTKATQQLRESQEELNKVEPGFANAFAAAAAGSLSGSQLEEIIQKYQKIILSRTNPNITLPKDISLPPESTAGILPYQSTSTAATIKSTSRDRTTAFTTPKIDLTELEHDADLVKTLFDGTGKQITATFEASGQNIDLISAAIAELKARNDPLAGALEKTFSAFISQHDIIRATSDALEIYQARIDAIQNFDPAKASGLQKFLNLIKQYIDAVNSTPESPGAQSGPNPDARADSKSREERIKQANKLLLDVFSGNKKVTADTLEPVLRDYYDTMIQGTKDAIPYLEFVRQVLQGTGFDLKELGLQSKDAFDQVSDSAKEAASALGESGQNILEGLAAKSANLQADLQSGNIEPKDYNRENAALKENIAITQDVIAKYQELIATTPGFNEALASIQENFTGINGLQDAASLSTDQFITRLLTLGETYGLNGKQLDELHDKLIKMISTLDLIAKLKVQFPVTATFNTKALIQYLKALYAASAVNIEDLQGGQQRSHGGDQSLLEAIRQLEAIGGGGDFGIGNLYRSGSGSKSKGGGSSKKKGAGSDVSTLDIPEEILNAPNSAALIQEAIKRARALQGKIPGANAAARNDIVELLKGTQRILEVRGVKDDLLRKALEELADIEKKKLEFETKADTIRRIRVGAGDFAAIANVPVNSKTGVSLGGANGPINVTLNINGTILTPAQLAQFADLVAAALKRQIANG
jgi:TP901 family phage tail tape measure protein